ncbi:hypothetical protein ACWGJW_27975 [Streptomyces nigrescens]
MAGWLAMALPRSGERDQRYRREENEDQFATPKQSSHRGEYGPQAAGPASFGGE